MSTQDPGFTVRCDVGRVHHAERRVHPQSTGISLIARRRMAGHAIGGPREVIAARNQVGISGLLPHRAAGIACNQSNCGEQAREQTSDMHSGSARRLVVAFEAFETRAKIRATRPLDRTSDRG